MIINILMYYNFYLVLVHVMFLETINKMKLIW